MAGLVVSSGKANMAKEIVRASEVANPAYHAPERDDAIREIAYNHL